MPARTLKPRLVIASLLALTLSLPATASQWDAQPGTWYGSVEAGASLQDHDAFQFGQIGSDSNDPGFRIDDPSIDFDSVGPDLRFNFGRRVNDRDGFAFTFRWANASDDSRLSHSASDYEGEEDPDGNPFNSKNPAFQVVYIDGPGDPVDNELNADRLKRGTVGLRLVQALSHLDYDSTALELGGDWTRILRDDERSMVQMLVGLQYHDFEQDFDNLVSGAFSDDADAEHDQFSDLSERVDEWFAGPRVMFRGHHLITKAGGAAFDWHAGAALLYHDSSFRGVQHVDGAAGEFTAKAKDDDTGGSVRLEAGFGFSWKAGSRVWLGLAYGCEYWSEVAAVRNPEISLEDIDGDTRWVADLAAHLDMESMLRHVLVFRILW